VQAIFSDDSDDEVESTSLNKVENPEKKIEAATTTLNRLIAGDFLESLGKELGLEVPSDLPPSTNKAKIPASQKEAANANLGDSNILSVKDNSPSTPISETCVNHEVPHNREIVQDGRVEKDEFIHGKSGKSVSIYMETGSNENKLDKLNPEKMVHEDSKAKTPSSRHRNWNGSSSSEDERSRKRSRRHRHKSSNSDSDLSSDHRDRYRSRSKGRKKGSSREKSSSSRRHSKHKHRSRDSPARSRYDSEKEHGEAKREKRKKRD
jgi:G patch domain-containing protein 1